MLSYIISKELGLVSHTHAHIKHTSVHMHAYACTLKMNIEAESSTEMFSTLIRTKHNNRCHDSSIYTVRLREDNSTSGSPLEGHMSQM